MWNVSGFEVEFWKVGQVAAKQYCTRSTADIISILTTTIPPLFLDVDAVLWQGAGNSVISEGEMLLWINTDGLAWVRLLEHCDYSPRDPARSELTGEISGFLDEEEEDSFSVASSNVITTEQAVCLLSYWLDCGGHLEELVW